MSHTFMAHRIYNALSVDSILFIVMLFMQPLWSVHIAYCNLINVAVLDLLWSPPTDPPIPPSLSLSLSLLAKLFPSLVSSTPARIVWRRVLNHWITLFPIAGPRCVLLLNWTLFGQNYCSFWFLYCLRCRSIESSTFFRFICLCVC